MSTRNIRSGIQVGTVSDNWSVSSDGTVRLSGSASTWEDIQTSLVGRRLSSTAGRVNINYAEQSVTFQNNGSLSVLADIVGMTIQYPHKAKADGELRLHIHWWQPDATVRQFTLEYRVQDNSAAKQETWTEVVVSTGGANDAFTYVSGTLNQITRLTSIDMSPYGISSVVQLKLTRTDSETGDIDATFLDYHYEIDSSGSKDEYVK